MADALSSGGSDLWSCGFNSRQPHHFTLPMNDALIARITQWNILDILPPQVGDFKLHCHLEMIEKGGEAVEYLLFSYRNDNNGWSVRAVLNLQSEEFSLRTDLGMLEFVLIEFITDDFELFRQMTETRLADRIDADYVHRERNFSEILKRKGVPVVAWDEFLPETCAGFTRIICPGEAVRIINGSYMILAYYDGKTKSGLSLMYNVLRDDFFAEQRIHNFPNLVHEFDSKELKVLKGTLQKHLVPVLSRLRIEADR